MPFKPYADTPGRRSFQLGGDLLLLAWIYVCILAGQAVHAAILALAEPSRRFQAGASDIGASLLDVGERAGGIPLVGDELAGPFRDAGAAAESVADAGRQQVEAITDLATLLGLVIAGIPIVLAILVWVPPRVRFAQRAAVAQQFVDSDADLHLFALRAMSRQPMHILARISPDPVGAWRAGDAATIRALALLELRDSGLRPPPDRSLAARAPAQR